MKQARNLVLILFTGLLSTPAIAGNIRGAPVERKGGTDGGGGNLIIRQSVDPQVKALVEHQLPHLKLQVEGVLNGLDVGAWGLDKEAREIPDSLRGKLFSPKDKGNDVFKTLRSLRFMPKKNGPCLDKNGEEVDASAFNEDPAEICFSLERIATVLTPRDWLIPVLALAVHEVVHKMTGPEDEEPLLIQKIVDQTISEKSLESGFEYGLMKEAAAQLLEEIRTAIKNLQLGLERNSLYTPAEAIRYFCDGRAMTIPEGARSMEGSARMTYRFGASALGRVGYESIVTYSEKVQSISGVCSVQNPKTSDAKKLLADLRELHWALYYMEGVSVRSR